MICSAAPWNRYKIKVHSDTQFPMGPPDRSGPCDKSQHVSALFLLRKEEEPRDWVCSGKWTNTRQGYVTRDAPHLLYFRTSSSIFQSMQLDGQPRLCPGLTWCPWVSLAVWIKTGCHDFCTFTTTILLVLYRLSFQELATNKIWSRHGV